MTWEIVYVTDEETSSSVEKWLNNLSKEMFKSITKELMLLSLAGNQLRLPHSKSLGNGLFELRERNYGLRIYYTFRPGKIIFLLLAGNKETQEMDIRIARKKLAQLQKWGVNNEIKTL